MTSRQLQAEEPRPSFIGILKGRSWKSFLFILLTGLIAISFLNYLIDPYGHYGTDVLNMNRIDARSWVVKILANQIKPPQLLLFGSSRCLRQKPNYDPQIYGLNVSLYGGAIEDHYCIFRYAVEKLNYPIKFVVVGLEPALMAQSHPIKETLIRNKTLNRWLIQQKSSTVQTFFQEPSYIKELSSLLSIKTLMDSGKVVFKYILKITDVREASAATVANESDTSHSASLVEKIVAAKDSMQARLRQYKKIYTGVVLMDPVRVQYLYKFALFAQEKGIRVIIFKPGYSQKFGQEMNKLNSFKKMHRELDILLAQLKKQFGWNVIDFRPPHWRGPELDFFDGVHPSNETARILDRAIAKVINNAI